MTDLVELFGTGVALFSERVAAVKDDQWDAPTPDDEWDVSALVRHLVDEHRWFPPLMHGQSLEAAGEIVEGTRDLPGDPAREWQEASFASLDAAREPDAPDRTVHLSRGETPARDYLREMITDLTIHSWDLQAAIGNTFDIPPELVSFAAEVAGGWGSIPGLFKEPLTASPHDSALDALLKRTGRDPHWSARQR